jgi:hypothetical protein
MPPHPAFSVEMGFHELFCLAWLSTVFLLILAFPVTGMTDVHHLTQTLVEMGVSQIQNHDPPDLSLLSSWDYRYEPPAPGL